MLLSAYNTRAHADLIPYTELKNRHLPNRRGIKIKPVTTHAAFSTEVQFDTNVFLESEDEKFDVITILNSSVGLELPLRDNKISVDYDFKANIFGIHKKHSYLDHRVRALAVMEWTDYTLMVLDEYKYFSDRSGSEDVNRVERQHNYLTGQVSAEFEQLKFDLGYTFGVEDFISDDTIFISAAGDLTYHDKNRFVHTFDGEISYRFLPKTSALLETTCGILRYRSPRSSDSWYTETVVGVRGDLRKNFSANIRAGIRYQSYSNSDLTDGKDFIGPVIRGGVSYSPTKDDTVKLNLERSIYESTFNNLNYYNVNHIGLDYRHFFTKKISGNAFGAYQLNLYPSEATVNGVTAKRYDNLYRIGCAMRYDMQEWISLEAKYEYKNRSSRFGTFNYMDNLFTINGTVGF